MKNILVNKIFTVSETHRIILHINSFDWDFTPGRAVTLSSGTVSLAGIQVGFGNHEGFAIVEISPSESWENVEKITRSLINQNNELISLQSD